MLGVHGFRSLAWSRPVVRRRQSALALGALVAATLAVAAPAGAAIGFTAPRTHAVGDAPRAVAFGDFNGDGDPDLAVANYSGHNAAVLLGGTGASFGPATTYAVGTFPTGVAVGDFNGDGDPDLAVSNSGGGPIDPGGDSVSILLGGTGGTFGASSLFAAGDVPMAVAVGQFNLDQDTDPDLVTPNGSGDNVSVLLGGTGGTFGTPAASTVGDAPTGVAVGNFNGDADPDLAVTNGGSDDVSILLGGSMGSFGLAINYSAADWASGVTTGDFDGDSDLDLAVSGYYPGSLAVLGGANDGTFGAPTTHSILGFLGGGIAAGDLNGDGDLDLALANGNSPPGGVVVVAEGGTGLSFSSPVHLGQGSATAAVAIADVNGDGDPDLALAQPGADSVAILLNTASAPPSPGFTASDPDPPANDNAPRLRGTAEAGSTVRLYSSPDCSGSPAATGSAAEFASPGLQVSVPDDSQTTFRATATNAADVPSACSSSSFTFVEASSPPSVTLSAAPNPALTGQPVSFSANAVSSIAVEKYEWDLNGDGSFELDTGTSPTASLSFAAPAELNPGVRATNDIGSNVARAPLSIRPAPPPGRVGVSVNNGDLFTNEPDVTVSIVWPPLSRTALLSNDGGFGSPGSFPLAAELPWRLDSTGPERLPKQVYVRFDDATATFSDDILLDETAPVVGGASVSGSSAARAAAARRRTYRVRVLATDATSGVNALQVTANKRKPGKLRRYRRTSRFRKTVRYRTSASRIYVRVRDAAGNYSRWRRATRR